MEYFVGFTSGGVPTAGLTLAWETLVASTSGDDRAAGNPIGATDHGGGLYMFEIDFGTAPWNTITEDLIGFIDGGATLADIDRYKFVAFTKRGLGLTVLTHKGIQTKATGDVVYYDADDATAALKADMTNAATTITRALAAP